MDPQRRSYFSYATFADPDGNGWLLQEVTQRFPGRVESNETSYASLSDLVNATRRAGRTLRLRVAVVERELVGGECSYWACIPSKTLLRPGEAAHAANEAAGKAEVDVAAALAWRDFMVSNHADAGQLRWLAANGITLLRGSGRLAGTGVVEVNGVRYTAKNVVLANGSEPIIPPVAGVRELEGVWTNREVTSMQAIPRRLLVPGACSTRSSRFPRSPRSIWQRSKTSSVSFERSDLKLISTPRARACRRARACASSLCVARAAAG